MQQCCEAAVKFMALAEMQVNDVCLFFEKFCTSIVKLKMLDVELLNSIIFDTFYFTLSNIWWNYTQCKIEESQILKFTAVMLNVNSLMKEICACLNPLKVKDKKPQLLAITTTTSQANVAEKLKSSHSLNSSIMLSSMCERSHSGCEEHDDCGECDEYTPAPTCSECN
ncbi:hypothetical protein GX50_01339 [[Emmonsia] crescens]|uniref:Uncharacterized protein n=1 Tax=[Emmonsia] crescens TaxID=73230 RepID=A0A2B7ZSL6_9EURO|nr:hypothetical protein GX50_01339 [Emmonsia crescens]